MPMDMCWKTDVKKCIKKLGKSHHWKIPLIPQKTGKGLKALTFPPHTTGPTQTHLIAACDPPFDVMWGTLKELELCSFQQKRSTASMAHGMENHARYTSFLYQKMIWSCWFPGNSKAISSMSSHQGLSKKSEARTNRLKVPLPYFGAPLCDLNYGRRFKLWSSGSLAGQRHPQVVPRWPCHKTRWPFLETAKNNKKLPPKKSNRRSNFRPLNRFIAVDVPDYCWWCLPKLAFTVHHPKKNA